MATTKTTNQHRGRTKTVEETEVELTIFGRRWKPEEWTTPLYLWGVFLIIAAAVNRMQAYGKLPAGGFGFIGGCLVMTALFALCGLMLGGRASMKIGTAAWCVATPVLGGVWILYVSLAGMTSGMWPWIIFTGLALVTSVWFRTMRDAQRDHELYLIYGAAEEAENEAIAEAQLHLARQQSPAPDADKAKWEAWTDEAGLPGMIFHGRHPMKNKSGIMLHYELPDDGSVSIEAVENSVGRLELRLMKKHRSLFHLGRVRPGCVRIMRATDEDGDPLVGELFICIDVVDILRKTLHMPTRDEDYTPLSISQAFQIGEFVDGSPIYLTIFEIHVLIIGQTQHGKSNLLHIMIRQLARCTDAVLWALDFKGGDTIRLWMNPYMKGMIDPHTGKPLDRCIFDWVATEPIEAERILMAALEAAKRRPAIAEGGGWVPSPAKPAIIFLADEISEVVGSNGGQGGRSAFHVSADVLSALLTRLFKLGTGQGVYGITASQRGTVGNVGSGDAKSQQKGRILLPVTEGVSDVLQGSGPEARRQASLLKHKGSLVIEGWEYAEGKAGKVWLMGHKPEIQEKVTEEVLKLTWLRRDVKLDPETEDFILKFGYTDRPGGPNPDADRMAWYYGSDPKRQLLTWDYRYAADGTAVLASDPAAAQPAAGSTTGPTGSSLRDRLGLSDVESPFGTPLHATPPGPATTVPTGQPGALTAPSQASAAARMEWEDRNRKVLADLGLDAGATPIPGTEPSNVLQFPRQPAAYTVPDVPAPDNPVAPPPLFPAGQQPTYENCTLLMIHLIHEAGSAGISGADLQRKMEEAGHAPSRTGLYPWLGRLVKDTAKFPDDTKRVIKEGSVMMTAANKPMPSKMA